VIVVDASALLEVLLRTPAALGVDGDCSSLAKRCTRRISSISKSLRSFAAT